MVFEFFESPCHLWFIDGWLKCRTRSSQCVQHNETEYWIEEDSINDGETGKLGKRSSAEKVALSIYICYFSKEGGEFCKRRFQMPNHIPKRTEMQSAMGLGHCLVHECNIRERQWQFSYKRQEESGMLRSCACTKCRSLSVWRNMCRQ